MIGPICWFNPKENFTAIAAMGHKAVSGPEPSGTAQNVWALAAQAAGLSVILKNPVAPIPANCIGFMLKDDEVNEPKGAGWPKTAAQLQPEYDALAALAPDIPIFCTLGGDKMLYDAWPSAPDAAYYKSLAAMGPRLIFAVDFYPCNRSNKYPMTFPAKAISNLKKVITTPVYAILEGSDQQLKAPNPPETNSGPTPDQIKQQFGACIPGADGVWWFYTAQNGKYGWTPPGSWLPEVDRTGATTAPQYAMIKQLNLSLNPIPPAPSDHDRIVSLENWAKTLNYKPLP